MRFIHLDFITLHETTVQTTFVLCRLHTCTLFSAVTNTSTSLTCCLACAVNICSHGYMFVYITPASMIGQSWSCDANSWTFMLSGQRPVYVECSCRAGWRQLFMLSIHAEQDETSFFFFLRSARVEFKRSSVWTLILQASAWLWIHQAWHIRDHAESFRYYTKHRSAWYCAWGERERERERERESDGSDATGATIVALKLATSLHFRCQKKIALFIKFALFVLPLSCGATSDRRNETCDRMFGCTILFRIEKNESN